MFDAHTLSQLSKLKKQIREQEQLHKKLVTGQVRGSNQRFGFVVLDNGQQVYLPPHEMDKVFPDDRVKIHVMDARKNTKRAEIVEILKTSLSTFHGQYIVQGHRHYVKPDLPRVKRWLWIPVTNRQNAQSGDYVKCIVTSHPYPHGKPEAKIVQVIGNIQKTGIETDFIISKFGLHGQWPVNWQSSLISDDIITHTAVKRRDDLTELPIITIDAASTLDVDDGLYATHTNDGWQLTVAIADPSELVANDSVLEQEAKQRATSVYMPGRVIPMLPEHLSNDHCSLLPQQRRLAIVCQMAINREGHVTRYEIKEAIVRSHAKLSYRDVARFYDGALEQINGAHTLNCLLDVATALKKYRENYHIISDSQLEFRLILSDQKKIHNIVPQRKNNAYSLVEECMIAANCCAADFLGEKGLFVTHAGFQTERLNDINKLAKEQLGLCDIDFSTLEGYKQLMKAAASQQTTLPILSILKRLLKRSQLSTAVKPHFAMGLMRYTTFTSPLRKYSDFFVHRLLKARLNGYDLPTLDKTNINRLQKTLMTVRRARNQMEQWLQCQFIEPMVGQSARGIIANITSKGLTVQLVDTGIEGFIDVKHLQEKVVFDPVRLTLKSDRYDFMLDMPITVTIKEVDSFRRHIGFELSEEEH